MSLNPNKLTFYLNKNNGNYNFNSRDQNFSHFIHRGETDLLRLITGISLTSGALLQLNKPNKDIFQNHLQLKDITFESIDKRTNVISEIH